MKIFINMLMVLALVMTTSFPTMSHAMMAHDSAKVEKVEASLEHGDCHHHDEAKATSGESIQNNKYSLGHCCDKGMCKCATGSCYGGLAAIFGNENFVRAPSASKNTFGFSNQFVDSALPERLKRPPRA